MHARRLEAVRDERLTADGDARLSRGPAHVEREDLVYAVVPRGIERGKHASRGPGLEQQDRRFRSSLAGCETTARYHHSEWRVGGKFVHALVEASQIFRDERLNVRIGDRRRHTLELAYF